MTGFNLVQTLGPFPKINPELDADGPDLEGEWLQYISKNFNGDYLWINSDSSDHYCQILYENSNDRDYLIEIGRKCTFEHMYALFYKIMLVCRFMFSRKLTMEEQRRAIKSDSDPIHEALYFHSYLSACWDGINGWKD